MINTQRTNKLYLIIIAILLIANITMLVFYFQQKRPDRPAGKQDRRAYIASFLQKEIGFDQQQLQQYDSISKLQSEKVRREFDTIRSNKNIQFKQLVAAGFSDSVINELAGQSAVVQKVIETNMFLHVRNIRQICTPQQQPLFDSLFIKIFNRRNDGRKKTSK